MRVSQYRDYQTLIKIMAIFMFKNFNSMKFKYIYTLVLSVVLVTSCEVIGSISDIKPEGVLTDETLITDNVSAQVALNGVYKSWRSYDISVFRNLMNVLTKVQSFSTIMGESPDFRNNDIQIDNMPVEKFYTALYYVINSANTFIANVENKSIPGLSDAEKANMLAQAKFHRAMAHLMLLRSYGEFYDLSSSKGIVISKEPVRENISQARANVRAVYTFIESDLDYAALNIKDVTKYPYIVNKTAVIALQTKVALYKNEFSKVITLADKTLDNALVSGNGIEDSYLDIFKTVFRSKEILFTLYTNNPDETLISAWSPFSMGATGTGISAIAMELWGSVEPNIMAGTDIDPRFGQTFAYFLQLGPNGINKYIKDNIAVGTESNTYYFLRLAEVYLMKAEAAARLNDYNTAKQALKVITNRAGYAESYVDNLEDSQLLLYILKHKYIELMAENNEDWFDFVRYYKLDKLDASTLGMAISMKHLILPIPKAALAGNNLLIQNDNYEK